MTRKLLLRGLVPGLFLLAFVLVLMAPAIIKNRLNAGLSDMPGGYRGTVQDVEIKLFEAGVVLHGFEIAKKDGSVKTPYLTARALEAKVVRGVERFRPELALRILSPQVNIVDADVERRTQFGPDMTLEDIAQKLPLDLRRIAIVEGEVHLRHFEAKPPVDVYVSHLNVRGDELSRCLPPAGACNAKFSVRGRPMGHGSLIVTGELNHDDAWTGDARGSLTNVHLNALSPLLTKYVEIDVKSGEAGLEGDLHLRGRRYFGALRPRLEGVDVLGKDSDGKRRVGREMVAGVAAHFIEKRDGRLTVRFEGEHGTDNLTFDLEVADHARAAADEEAP